MTLEDQVTSLEISKRLKELGVKQESQFYWHKPIGDDGKPNGAYFLNWKDSYDFCDDDSHDHKPFSAFTVAELGEVFPRHYQIYSYPIAYNKSLWDCTSTHKLLQTTEGWERGQRGCPPMFADTEANARGKMLIYLIENKLIDLDSYLQEKEA